MKLSKYLFGQPYVGFLGHIISGGGVNLIPEKLKAMENCPTPNNIKQLRGFVGLTGYDMMFFKGYAKIEASMIDLRKKNAFLWCIDLP